MPQSDITALASRRVPVGIVLIFHLGGAAIVLLMVVDVGADIGVGVVILPPLILEPTNAEDANLQHEVRGGSHGLGELLVHCGRRGA